MTEQKQTTTADSNVIWEGTFAGHAASVKLVNDVAEPFIENNPYMFTTTHDAIMAKAIGELAAERDEAIATAEHWQHVADKQAKSLQCLEGAMALMDAQINKLRLDKLDSSRVAMDALVNAERCRRERLALEFEVCLALRWLGPEYFDDGKPLEALRKMVDMKDGESNG